MKRMGTLAVTLLLLVLAVPIVSACGGKKKSATSTNLKNAPTSVQQAATAIAKQQTALASAIAANATAQQAATAAAKAQTALASAAAAAASAQRAATAAAAQATVQASVVASAVSAASAAAGAAASGTPGAQAALASLSSDAHRLVTQLQTSSDPTAKQQLLASCQNTARTLLNQGSNLLPQLNQICNNISSTSVSDSQAWTGIQNQIDTLANQSGGSSG